MGRWATELFCLLLRISNPLTNNRKHGPVGHGAVLPSTTNLHPLTINRKHGPVGHGAVLPSITNLTNNRKQAGAVMIQSSRKTYRTYYKILKFSGSGAHPAFYSTGIGFLYRGYSDRALKLPTHLYLVSSLRMSGAILLLPYRP